MGMMGSLFGNYMNITKITTEVYNWDAAINLSREDAIKFAKDILELCGETFSTTIKEYSPVIKPVQYALKDPTTKSYDIFSNEEKIQYVDAKQNYAKSLVYSMDLASFDKELASCLTSFAVRCYNISTKSLHFLIRISVMKI